jgi:hypothetical protein
MSKYISFLLLLSLLASCKQEKETPKVRYEDASKEKVQPKADTTLIAVADLPIHFEGTNFLIHPIGNLNTSERARAYDASSGSNADQSFTVSNTNDFQITGYLSNLKFQAVNSDSLKVLSDKPIMVETATYLKTFADKNKIQLMVYTLSDSDTNKDGKLDGNDIQSLYLSDTSGNKFTKISPDLNELIDWNSIDSNGKIYFRTIEDSNKNGAFDKNDLVHYHYINLLSNDWESKEYKPVN